MRRGPRGPWRGIWHGRTEFTLVAALLIVGFFATSSVIIYSLWGERPDLYSPERVDIVKAQLDLDEAYDQSTKAAQLREDIRKAHFSVENALSHLDEAEQLDPADRAQIAKIRRELAALDDAEKMERMTPEELHDVYQTLSEHLTQLAQKLE